MATQEPMHQHPGGDIPHRHAPDDALATHGTGEESFSQRDEQTVQLREEELQARKQVVEAGQVHIGKDVVTEQRTLDVPVQREEVTIERHPVDRRPADSPISAEDQTIRVPIYEEQVTVEKRPVVTEEVAVSTRPVQETQRVSGSVRREEAHIEREGEAEIDQDR
jgi:uncharacterized protein (TIGR02271 family)